MPQSAQLAPGTYDSLPAIGSFLSAFANSLPRLEDEATVEVKGQPGATKRDLYFLALATASSLVRRFDAVAVAASIPPAPGMLMIEYDAAANWVRCTLRYSTNFMYAIGNNLIPFSGQPNPLEAPVFQGPKEVTYGQGYNFGPNILGLGNGGLAGLVLSPLVAKFSPAVPWVNRNILTPNPTCFDPTPGAPVPQPSSTVVPSLNPKPTGDNRSRGTVGSFPPQYGGNPTDAGPGTGLPQFTDRLIPVVFAALTGPNSTAGMVYAAPLPGVAGG